MTHSLRFSLRSYVPFSFTLWELSGVKVVPHTVRFGVLSEKWEVSRTLVVSLDDPLERYRDGVSLPSVTQGFLWTSRFVDVVRR